MLSHLGLAREIRAVISRTLVAAFSFGSPSFVVGGDSALLASNASISLSTGRVLAEIGHSQI
jgi:hypothetical protein